MEKRDTRLFQLETAIRGRDTSWNIVELESHRDLRQKIDDILHLTLYNAMSSSELQQALSLLREQYGSRCITLLVRCLYTKNAEKRQAVVQLLTLFHAPEAIPQLQRIVHDEQSSRSVRLAASLALAGMSATPETRPKQKHIRSYAIS
ncbi:MAG TPA: hypothetical protein VL485_23995 [Ktedonobacteraceae bacterium]|nr:hypothetical protein [Ktedonobacteraceae bacterium]